MIVKLSDMTEEQRHIYLQYFNTFISNPDYRLGLEMLKPAKGFNIQGLRFPSNFLNDLGKKIIFFPVEIMAEYVDSNTKDMVDKNNTRFIYDSFFKENFDLDHEFKTISATAIGNLAYILTNCKNENARIIAEVYLNGIFLKAKQTFNNKMSELNL